MRFLVRHILVLTAVAGLAGCGGGRFHADYSSGMEAMEMGDLFRAKRNLGRAVEHSESGFMKPLLQMDVRFQYARVLGLLCEHAAAEREFLRARERAQEVPGDAGIEKRFLVNAELGHLNFDTGNMENAVSYYEEATSLASQFPEIFSGSPHVVRVLADYSDALSRSGDREKAKIVKNRMDRIVGRKARTEGPVVSARSAESRYPRQCGTRSGELPVGHPHHDH